MKPLFDIQKLSSFKSREKLPIECSVCSSVFYKQKNEIQKIIKGSYHGSGLYCSLKCKGKKDSKQIKLSCTFCKKEISKAPNSITENNFCSLSCHAKFQHANKKTGFRRSKAEIYLTSLIQNDFPAMDVETSNRNLLNGLEIDILIPSIKLAIELNGPVHYYPIFGQTKFAKIVENDSKKISSLIKMQYGVIIVDISTCNYWKTTQPFLDKYYSSHIKPIIEKGKEGNGIEP